MPITAVVASRIAVSLLRVQTDARLAQLCAAGHELAFATLVERYRAPLLRHCARMLPADRAQDAVQQTLIAAHRALARGDAVDDVRAWLYRIAHNASLSILRERAWQEVPLESAPIGVGESIDAVLERRERMAAAIGAVGALPERQREALVLQALEGRTHDQIARRLQTSDGAVRQLLARARGSLRAGVTAVAPIGLLLRWGARDGHAIAGATGISGGTGLVVAKGIALLGASAAVTGVVGIAEHHAHPTQPPPAPLVAAGHAISKTPVTPRPQADDAGGAPRPREQRAGRAHARAHHDDRRRTPSRSPAGDAAGRPHQSMMRPVASSSPRPPGVAPRGVANAHPHKPAEEPQPLEAPDGTDATAGDSISEPDDGAPASGSDAPADASDAPAGSSDTSGDGSSAPDPAVDSGPEPVGAPTPTAADAAAPTDEQAP